MGSKRSKGCPKYKVRYRAMDWPGYDQALRRRARSLTGFPNLLKTWTGEGDGGKATSPSMRQHRSRLQNSRMPQSRTRPSAAGRGGTSRFGGHWGWGLRSAPGLPSDSRPRRSAGHPSLSKGQDLGGGMASRPRCPPRANRGRRASCMAEAGRATPTSESRKHVLQVQTPVRRSNSFETSGGSAGRRPELLQAPESPGRTRDAGIGSRFRRMVRRNVNHGPHRPRATSPPGDLTHVQGMIISSHR